MRATILYNPDSRGAIRDGSVVPVKGSTCGKAFASGKNQLINRLEDLEHDPETFGSSEGRVFFERVSAEGLKSGCELPLLGRKGVIGVLGAFSRTERAFTEDGRGIPEECKDRVFEPFFTTKPFGSGLGLGLDTVQRVVAKHFGAVAFDSSPRGTVFHVRLPIDRTEIY